MTTITGTHTPIRATLDDLYRVEGKAELINGRIVTFMGSGSLHNLVAAEIYSGLREYARRTKVGVVYTDGISFAVPELPSGRESFSPDASYYVGPSPAASSRFVQGPPTFAAEVRSENDYGNAAEKAMAAKRADYFAAGTGVVWDVDPVARSVHVYRATDPTQPTTFGRGQVADAEPAVPGWRIDVDSLWP